jgi:hypothetical protein
MRKEKKAFAGGGKRQQQTERGRSTAMYHYFLFAHEVNFLPHSLIAATQVTVA